MPLRSPEHSRGAKGGEYEKMKKILLVSLISIFATTSALPVLSAPEESLEVTITPTLVSVVISPTSVDLGTVPTGQESGSSGVVSAENNGSVTEDLDIKGSNAECTSGGDPDVWTLSDSNGPTQFVMKVSQDNWFSPSKNLSLSYCDLNNGVAVGTSEDFRVKIQMPTNPGVFAEHAANIHVLATQHL